MSIIFYFVYFSSLLIASNAVAVNQSNPICDCTNPIYMDKPTNFVQCQPQNKPIFYKQIDANYKIVYGFIDQPSAKNCDYTAYRNIVDEMKKATYQIVDSYFDCKESSCSRNFITAYKNYGKLASTKFAKFIGCSYIYYSPKCAVNIKHAVYFSAENILSTLLVCARVNFYDIHYGYGSKQLQMPSTDCNCVKIDPRPIPVSQEQCYSPKYFATLKKFITDNFDRIIKTYDDANTADPECTYNSFIERTKQLKTTALKWPNILQDPSPTFEKLSSFTSELGTLAHEINQHTLDYILGERKKCYFTVRQLRQSGLTISNYVIQILTKCINYKDPSHSPCKLTKKN